MKEKNTIISIILIIVLVIILGVLWYFILSDKSSNNNSSKHDKQTSNSSSITYSSPKEITKDETIKDENYESSKSDENAILISGKIKSSLSNITISKIGDSDGGDNTSFYGINSAILAKDGASVTIKNATIETNATGANGVFSYGGNAKTNNTSSDGTIINISNSTITTKKGNSGGIMTTGGGTTNAKNLTITTDGQSSAAIRSDRGGGIVNVDGGTYTTNGVGSPTIYSTAEITVKNAKDSTVTWTKDSCLTLSGSGNTRTVTGNNCGTSPKVTVKLNNGATSTVTLNYEPTLTYTVYDNTTVAHPLPEENYYAGYYELAYPVVKTNKNVTFSADVPSHIKSSTSNSVSLKSERTTLTIKTACNQQETLKFIAKIN